MCENIFQHVFTCYLLNNRLATLWLTYQETVCILQREQIIIRHSSIKWENVHEHNKVEKGS